MAISRNVRSATITVNTPLTPVPETVIAVGSFASGDVLDDEPHAASQARRQSFIVIARRKNRTERRTPCIRGLPHASL